MPANEASELSTYVGFYTRTMTMIRFTSRDLSRGVCLVAFLLSAASVGSAQIFDLSWMEIDGGGEMFTTGGSFELSGSIGQPDAGVMTGGDFELVGGFWPGAGGGTCAACDMNCDGDVNAIDIEPFLDCLFSP